MNDISVGPFLIWRLPGDIGIDYNDTTIGLLWKVRLFDWRTGIFGGPRITKRWLDIGFVIALGPLKARILFMTRIDTVGVV